MKLKKCKICKTYNLNSICICGEKTKEAHYKFIKLKGITLSGIQTNK